MQNRSVLFYFKNSTVIRSEFGSQVSVSCSSHRRGQGGGDSSIGMGHETSLKSSRCQVSGEGMGVGIPISVRVIGGSHSHGQQASENLKFQLFQFLRLIYTLQKDLPRASSWLLQSQWRTVKLEGGTRLIYTCTLGPLLLRCASVHPPAFYEVHSWIKI